MKEQELQERDGSADEGERRQLDRLLKTGNTSVTIGTLRRAASGVRRRLRVGPERDARKDRDVNSFFDQVDSDDR